MGNALPSNPCASERDKEDAHKLADLTFDEVVPYEEECSRLDAPIKVVRRVTNPGCAITAVITLVVLGLVAAYARHFRNPNVYNRRGTAFPQRFHDFSGRACGRSIHAGEPYVFFCRKQNATKADFVLDYVHPVCRPSCPTASPGATPETMQYCPLEANGTMHFSWVPDYASQPVAGTFCLPVDPGLVENRLFETIEEMALKGADRTWVLEASIIQRGWVLIAISAATSALLGALYLHLLRTLTKAVVEISFILSVAGPAILSVVFINRSQWEAGFCAGSEDHCLLSGLGLLAVTCLAASLAVWLRRDLEAAVECVGVAAECVHEVPQLLWEPFAAAAMKAAIVAPLLAMLLLLLSCGWVEVDPATDRVYFSHGAVNLLLISFCCLVLLWLLELSAALSGFAIGFAAQTWYCRLEQLGSSRPITAGYAVALRWHFGTLALGSCVLPLVRIPRVVAARLDIERKSEVHRLHKRAYMDTVTSGGPFFSATVSAELTMRQDLPRGLEGVTFVCAAAGVGAAASAGCALAFTLSRCWPRFSDPQSPQFVQDPTVLAATAAAASFVVALPFVSVVDQVVDAVLYCIAAEGGVVNSHKRGIEVFLGALELRRSVGNL